MITGEPVARGQSTGIGGLYLYIKQTVYIKTSSL